MQDSTELVHHIGPDPVNQVVTLVLAVFGAALAGLGLLRIGRKRGRR